MERLFEIIHEDAELLVINKPAGLVCHPTKGDAYSSLISRVRLHLGDAIRPHMINRLDRETSGVMLVAKQDGAARELRRLWETRNVHKEYLAIVHGHVRLDQGVIEGPLGRDETSGVAIKDCVRPDGAPSQTDFLVQRRFWRLEDAYTLLRIRPRTGRKHQIRIHLADFGHPIVGDKLYGGDENLYLDFAMGRQTEEQRQRLILQNQALHARSVRFIWRDQEWIYQAEAEGWFVEFAGDSREELKFEERLTQ
jgi:23S rRNA pseudouridine1911/1915/1917 synthase